MKKTAKAYANIAFIKYWGKTNEELRLPSTSSVSMNLDKCFTLTTVEFAQKYYKDSFELIGGKVTEKEIEKVSGHLSRIRKIAKSTQFAKVVSQNSFPKDGGVASSASGFAALTVAAANALDLDLSEKELSILARLGSGSACRSIPDGFVEWCEGKTSEESFARSLYSPSYWDLRDILVIVSTQAKKIASTLGHHLGKQSIFYEKRVSQAKKLFLEAKKAFLKKDFPLLGEIMEKDCLAMHSVMMTGSPPLFYWLPKTVEIIQKIYQWREEGIPVYFTIDAGPNVHLICEGKDEKRFLEKVNKIKEIKNIIINKPARGAYLINEHLF